MLTFFTKSFPSAPVNRFKFQGALNALKSLSGESKKVGVVSRSSGNFAPALGHASKLLKIPAIVVMPLDTPQIKIRRTEATGIEVILHGRNHAESEDKVTELITRQGRVRLSPFDHNDVIAGQGTIALEILEDLPETSTVFLPIGGRWTRFRLRYSLQKK
jgi:threonine dehydratase